MHFIPTPSLINLIQHPQMKKAEYARLRSVIRQILGQMHRPVQKTASGNSGTGASPQSRPSVRSQGLVQTMMPSFGRLANGPKLVDSGPKAPPPSNPPTTEDIKRGLGIRNNYIPETNTVIKQGNPLLDDGSYSPNWVSTRLPFFRNTITLPKDRDPNDIFQLLHEVGHSYVYDQASGLPGYRQRKNILNPTFRFEDEMTATQTGLKKLYDNGVQLTDQQLKQIIAGEFYNQKGYSRQGNTIGVAAHPRLAITQLMGIKAPQLRSAEVIARDLLTKSTNLSAEKIEQIIKTLDPLQ